MSENWYDSRSQGGFFFRERTTASALATMGIAIIGVMMIGWGGWLKRSGDARRHFVRSKRNCRCRLFAHWTKHGEDDVTLVVQLCVFMFAAGFFTIDNIVTNTTFLGYSRLDWGMFVLLATVPTLSHLNQ
ncbi:hypothetical protein ACFQDF_00740 [Ectobacillus funiculus]